MTIEAVEHVGERARLPRPQGVRGVRLLFWPTLFLVVFHLVALLACVPWFFSWTGVVLAILGIYGFGVLGINLCYHRLLTHRSFRCSKRFEHVLAILALCCVQDTPIRWVAVHRRHHQHADAQPDPHSPLVDFAWAHFGWILVRNDELNWSALYDQYARDLLKDPFYRRLERHNAQLWAVVISAYVFFLGGFLAGLLIWRDFGVAAQFGASLVVWGVFVRTVIVWHQTWSVNSIAHLWGYRSYETGEGSRNNVFVGIFANGEGWHNNHHADQRAARHGHRWWELDTTYLTIRVMARIGLVRDVIMPDPRLTERLAATTGRTPH